MAKRPAQNKKYITRRGIQERWCCSHMFVERKIRTDPLFPPYTRLGDGPKAKRQWILDDIEAL